MRLTDIRAISYVGGLWTSRGGSATGNINTTGNITSTAVGTFGQFSFGSVSWILATQFLNLSASAHQGYNQVEWKTLKEVNVNRFELQRADDGISFNTIATIGARNNIAGSEYSYNDRLPFNGIAWYRVLAVDKDGKQNYSTIVPVKSNGSNKEFYLYKNPSSANVYIVSNSSHKGLYQYSINSVDGQLIQKGSVRLPESGGITTIQMSSHKPGTYLITLNNSTERLSGKISVR